MDFPKADNVIETPERHIQQGDLILGDMEAIALAGDAGSGAGDIEGWQGIVLPMRLDRPSKRGQVTSLTKRCDNSF